MLYLKWEHRHIVNIIYELINLVVFIKKVVGFAWCLLYEEGNVLFNDTLNTFYLWLYDIRHMVKNHSDRERETHPHYMGYSFRLAARILFYASSHRWDDTYHSLCYTSMSYPLCSMMHIKEPLLLFGNIFVLK